jgi:hypothetical protein
MSVAGSPPSPGEAATATCNNGTFRMKVFFPNVPWFHRSADSLAHLAGGGDQVAQGRLGLCVPAGLQPAVRMLLR